MPFPTYKEQLELFERWNGTPTPVYFDELIDEPCGVENYLHMPHDYRDDRGFTVRCWGNNRKVLTIGRRT